MHRSINKARQSGFAFIGVLILVALLGILALAILSIIHNDRSRAQTELDTAKAESLADAGAFLILHKLCNAKLVNEVAIDGQITSTTFAVYQVDSAVQDEYGKIDLNFGPKELIQSLFASAGLTADEAMNIANSIEKIRNTTFKSISDENLTNTSPSLRPASSTLPFQSTEQLKAIPEVSNEIFERVRPAITVYSKRIDIQTATAPPEVLRALPGMSEDKINEVLKQRQQNPVTAGDIGFSESAAGQGIMTGRAFTIFSRATINGRTFKRRAVVLIMSDSKQPYKILDWTTDY